MDRYKEMLSISWSNRIEKLRRTICSWTGRYFDNIKQKIEVVNCFALSRIFYVAALLPITKSALQDINKIVGNFLWNKSWKLLRVAREEIVNSEAKGGLALLDTESMCNSLIVSQTFRLMKSGDFKSQRHLYYWMSEAFDGVWDGPSNCITVENYESEHFNLAAGLLSNARMLESFDITDWSNISNKMIYQSFSDTFTKPKIERDLGRDMSQVWFRLKLLRYNRQVQEVTYLMIHNKLPLNERLFRIKLARDPYCSSCSSACVQDVVHFFTCCDSVKIYWEWIKDISTNLLAPMAVDDHA